MSEVKRKAKTNIDDVPWTFVVKRFGQLKGRDRSIVDLYYGLDDTDRYTFQEIGRMLNLTRERVRQKIAAIHEDTCRAFDVATERNNADLIAEIKPFLEKLDAEWAETIARATASGFDPSQLPDAMRHMQLRELLAKIKDDPK